MSFTPEEVSLIKEQFGKNLFQSIDTSKKLEGMSNEELGKFLFYHVWVDVEIFTPQSDLLLEVIKRLGFVIPDQEEE